MKVKSHTWTGRGGDCTGVSLADSYRWLKNKIEEVKQWLTK